jgi:hypothetical protein
VAKRHQRPRRDLSQAHIVDRRVIGLLFHERQVILPISTATPWGRSNVTDPDSRNVKTPRGYVQGYNAQAAVNEGQIVIAAEVNADSSDFGHLKPMVDVARQQLAVAGVTDTPEVVVADAGYWHQAQMESIELKLLAWP